MYIEKIPLSAVIFNGWLKINSISCWVRKPCIAIVSWLAQSKALSMTMVGIVDMHVTATENVPALFVLANSIE